MKNLIKISLFVFSIFVIQTTLVYATGYNYLPNDVYIKQQEEKSALEYRLKNLENQIQNNPANSANSVSQRISEIQQERDTEKNYISGVYSHNGLGDQLSLKLAEIDAKYQSQINVLQQQQSNYQSQSSALDKVNREADELRQKIVELQKQAIQQLDDYQKLLDQNLEQLKKAPQTTNLEITDAEVQEVFDYMESLDFKSESIIFAKIAKINPNVATRIVALYDQKYPNGKTGSPKNDKYLKSIQENIKVEVPEKIEKPVIKQETKKVETNPLVLEEKTTSQFQAEQPKPQIEQIKEQKPVQVKTTFKQKVSGFFKRIFGIK